MDLEILPTLNLFCSHETRRHLLHHKSNFPCARAVAPCDLPCPFPANPPLPCRMRLGFGLLPLSWRGTSNPAP